MKPMSYCRLLAFKRSIRTILQSRVNNTVKTPTRLISISEHQAQKIVLGIETSCDDTGAAVVNENGLILGDALHSQTKVHVDYGGIVPSKAQALHRESITTVVQNALEKASVTLSDLDAIAVTNRPGLSLCLRVGVEYAKELVTQSGKPLIPIHHMEAHALTVRLLHKIEFPFLVFLMSGGHCLLAVARGVEDFALLGTSIDIAPGDCIDKTARALNVKKIEKCQGLPGGAAIELLARDGDPSSFPIPHVMSHYRDCDFSFSGIQSYFQALVEQQRENYNLSEEEILPNVCDLAAALQYTIIRAMSTKLMRAFTYCELKGLLPETNKVLVASGGVASNMYFRQCLTQICEEFSCQMICPPPHLCTDNGIMIAWNGMEKLLTGTGIEVDPMSLRYEARAPLGVDMREDVRVLHMKLPKFRLKL